MSNELEVIKVKHEDGFMIINKSDFDKSKHVLYKEEKKPVRKRRIKKEDK